MIVSPSGPTPSICLSPPYLLPIPAASTKSVGFFIVVSLFDNIPKVKYFCGKGNLKLGKVKDIWNGRHKGFVRYATVITALALIYALFFSDDNLLRWCKAGIELRRQRRQIERYQEEIKSMDERIKTLSTDRDSLEQYARENFNFAEPGDDVYLVK